MSNYPREYPIEMYQTGSNIFKKIGSWLKKSKIASKIGSVVGPIAGIISPGVGKAVGAATKLAKQAGYGHAGGRCPKPLEKSQVDCLLHGEGIRLLKSGAVSLAGARHRYRKSPPKNITPGQFRALVEGKARWGKGGSLNFDGSGPTLPGRGVSLPGRGVYLAGQTGQKGAGTKKGMVRKTARRAYIKKKAAGCEFCR